MRMLDGYWKEFTEAIHYCNVYTHIVLITRIVYHIEEFEDTKGVRDRPWFFVSIRILFSDNTRVRIYIFFVAQSANFFSRI